MFRRCYIHHHRLGNVGGKFLWRYSINNSGLIVGESILAEGQTHAFLYDGGMHDLTPAETNTTHAVDINNIGTVIGYVYSSTGGQIPVNTSSAFWFDSSIHYFDKDGWLASRATGINDSGAIVGYRSTLLPGSPADSQPFLFDGTMHDLSTLIGEGASVRAINSSGVVAGYKNGHAYYCDDTVHDLGILPGGQDYSEATGINNSGLVIGNAKNAEGNRHGFLYDGAMYDIGTLGGNRSNAEGINSLGQVVGSSYIEDGTYHAFIYDGTIHDLNDFLPDGSGWVLDCAMDINDLGQIVGEGLIGGETHAFLMTPIPEPSTVMLAIMAMLCLAAYARRRVTAVGSLPGSTR